MYYTKALVPVDLSPESVAVLKQAACLTTFGVKQVVALHLYDVSGVESPVVRTMDQEAREALEKMVADIDPGLAESIIAEARCGIDSDCLFRAANELDVDLIVLGTRGKRPIEELLSGGLVEHVAREAPLPVLSFGLPLVVGRGATELSDAGAHLSDVILHPTDFSYSAGRALDAALDTHPKRLILAHAVDGASHSDAETDALIAEATRTLQTIRRRIGRDGLEIEIWTGVGEAAPTALQLADERGVTMIAAGSRGRGLVTEAILGGVSSAIMRSARVPVLVVH